MVCEIAVLPTPGGPANSALLDHAIKSTGKGGRCCLNVLLDNASVVRGDILRTPAGSQLAKDAFIQVRLSFAAAKHRFGLSRGYGHRVLHLRPDMPFFGDHHCSSTEPNRYLSAIACSFRIDISWAVFSQRPSKAAECMPAWMAPMFFKSCEGNSPHSS